MVIYLSRGREVNPEPKFRGLLIDHKTLCKKKSKIVMHLDHQALKELELKTIKKTIILSNLTILEMFLASDHFLMSE